MKTLFVFCALCSNMALAQSPPIKPDPAYTIIVFIRTVVQEQLLKQKPVKTPATSHIRSSAGAPSTPPAPAPTPICAAGTAPAAIRFGPTTTYAWGLIQISGDYYRINGYCGRVVC